MRKKRFLLPALGLLGLLLVVAFLPTAIGSRWIYGPILARMAADDFKVDIDQVTLRWFWPLQLHGVDVHQQSGQSLVSVSHIRTDRGLFGYLVGGRRLGRIEIDQPALSVALLQDGTNLERFVRALDAGAKTDPPQAKQFPKFDIEVLVQQLSAQVIQPGGAQPLVVVPPLDLQLRYQAIDGASRISLDATELLHDVRLTPELVQLGLGHAVPLLAKSAWFDGRVSLRTEGLDVPLNSPDLSRGNFQLTLHEVRSGPSDPAIKQMLELVARVRRTEAVHELVFVNGSTIDIKIEGGRVHHSGLKFGLPKMDERLQILTSGSVGLKDRSLDLVVEIPVPVEQLARRESVQQLGVPTLRLPVTGTLDEPRVNWEALRGDASQLLAVLRDALGDDATNTARVLTALEGLASGKADEGIATALELIEQVRQNRKASREARDSQEPSGGEESSRSQPVRDRLRDLFKRK